MGILKLGVQYTYKFLMVSSSDHISGKTGLNNAVTVYLSKGAGAAGTLATNSGASGSGTTELDSTNLPGWYQIILSASDLSSAGDLIIEASGTGADHTSLKEMVQSQIFTDLQLDNTGRVLISSPVKQNTSFILPFIMTVAGVPTPSLTGFAAQRNLAGAGFAPCVNSVVEDAGGWYHIVLASSDTNAAVVEVQITATGADTRNISFYTQP